MIDFKQYITELKGTKPANSNAQHDSDHDMVDVSDDGVVRKLNSFLGCIAEMDHMLPEQTISVVRRRLASIGLTFPNIDVVEDEDQAKSIDSAATTTTTEDDEDVNVRIKFVQEVK